jgi:hypothetical protein
MSSTILNAAPVGEAVSRLKRNVSLSDGIEEVVEQFPDPETEAKRSGKVLIDGIYNIPVYILMNITVGLNICEYTDSSPMLLSKHPLKKDVNTLGATVCEETHHSTFPPRPIREGSSIYKALRTFNSLKSRSDVLKIEYDSVRIGDNIYNTYLRRTGEGTVDLSDGRLFKFILQGIRRSTYYKRMLSKCDVEAVVLNHAYYTPSGVLGKLALDSGIDVYEVSQQNLQRIYTRKHSSSEEFTRSGIRPTDELYNHVYENHREHAVSVAEEILKKRFDGRGNLGGDAYSSTDELQSVDEFVTNYGIESDYPTVTILPHIFIDAVHRGDGMIFDDYLSWFRETLSIIADVPSVQWIIKPHPMAAMYNQKQDVVKEVSTNLGDNQEHVFLVDSETNTRFLHDISDALVTVRGTAGLEFSCKGIRPILSGDSRYSGLGSPIQPEDEQEYTETLNKSHKIQPLTTEEIEQAKTMLYVQRGLIGVENHDMFSGSDISVSSDPSGWSDINEYINMETIYSGRISSAVKRMMEQSAEFAFEPAETQVLP